MKNVGVLTFHNAINFGAALQCTALCEEIKELGYSVEIINYCPDYEKRGWSAFKNPFDGINQESSMEKQFIKMMRNMKTNIRYFQKKKKINEFHKYWTKHLTMTEECSSFNQVKDIAEKFDVLVCGSDQIWNPECTGGKLDPVYFLNFESISLKKIAYAPSLGGLKTKEYFDHCKKWVQSLSSVSVREASSKRQFEENGVYNVSAVLDPTLLLTREKWERVLTTQNREKCKYILVYTLDYCPELVSVLHQILNDKPMDVIDISSNSSKLGCRHKKRRSISPDNFYSYIGNAEIVLTNSFHATVFSVLQNKRFVAFSRPGMEGRIIDFLKVCDMSSHLYNAEKRSSGLDTDFDFNVSKKNIEIERKNSILFLENALEDN